MYARPEFEFFSDVLIRDISFSEIDLQLTLELRPKKPSASRLCSDNPQEDASQDRCQVPGIHVAGGARRGDVHGGDAEEARGGARQGDLRLVQDVCEAGTHSQK